MTRKLATWMGGLAVYAAATGVSPAALAFPSITMPPGSTVWIKAEATACAGGGDDDCVGSNLGGVNPPNGVPLTTVTQAGLGTATFYSEVLPDRVRSFNTSNPFSFLYSSFVDTYTVHGSALGTFPITVTLAGAGVAGSIQTSVDHRLSGNARFEIGTWDSSTGAIAEGSRVIPFGPPSNAFVSFPSTTQSVPFQVPFTLSATHTFTAGVDDSFVIAYGVNTQLTFGRIDLRDTGALIAFDLPEGVWITSEQGGVWGEPPAPQVPLPPLALGWTAVSLAALGCRSLRRRAR